MELPVPIMTLNTFTEGPYMTSEFSASQIRGGGLRKTRTNLGRKKLQAGSESHDTA
eukprot:m.131724 g.131724  ORF g.131724 m.131724 type:complete len:56 (+) comp20035_c0_seq1:59-226(+)